MENYLRVLHVDCSSGFYRMERFKIGDFFGPIDVGLNIAKRHNSLNIGAGLLAGSIFPGSNRLVVNGFSPNWGSFYISSMGGASLVFDNLGINMLSLRNRASCFSVLYLNRVHGEEVEVELHPVDVQGVWKSGKTGVYALMEYALERFGHRYSSEPRVLATGAASLSTDFGAIASAPVKNGKPTAADTWAGRGGFGTKLLKEHGIAAVIYGGTYIDEDFRDRKVADEWFSDRYQKRLAAKDMEATTKYRFDPNFDTGGTFGVNYAKIGGRVIAFNYRSIHMREDERRHIHEKFIVNHYLKQFNEEIIRPKSMRTCGEPCSAVCKKIYGEYKKDYEPYQTMGPLCGIFDQRAAELLNRRADSLGFDAISVGGVLSWLMECLHEGLLAPNELGVSTLPVFSAEGFGIETDSMHNAELGLALLDSIIEKKGILDLEEGARDFARHLARDRGKKILDLFVYNANARKGWIVPNQYWTAGVLSPMPIMGKYYMYYGDNFYEPRKLGRENADRFKKELIMDNMGFCRFHRNWAEEMIPDIIGTLYDKKAEYLAAVSITASRINSRNSSIFWESERNVDFVSTWLTRLHEVENDNSKELLMWIDRFKKDKHEAALEFWFEISKGVHESLREF
ncbi:MAG: aldehyde ferredoxin oxidoreductase [Spirochaetes bacterium]|jgi:glyceraldehyde-3-phosphate dehydrogenase (ferredoxin)|nr:aldehyde ferredoxin oxidoreductase [Spirochaetota bacterium]